MIEEIFLNDLHLGKPFEKGFIRDFPYRDYEFIEFLKLLKQQLTGDNKILALKVDYENHIIEVLTV